MKREENLDSGESSRVENVLKNTIYDPPLTELSVNLKYIALTRQRRRTISHALESKDVAAVAPFTVVSEASLLHLYLLEKARELLDGSIPVTFLLQDVGQVGEDVRKQLGRTLVTMNRMSIPTGPPLVDFKQLSCFEESIRDQQAMTAFKDMYFPFLSGDLQVSFTHVFLTLVYAEEHKAGLVLVGQNQAHLYEALMSFVAYQRAQPPGVFPVYLPQLPFSTGEQIPYVNDTEDEIRRKIESVLDSMPNLAQQLAFAMQIYRIFMYRNETTEGKLGTRLKELAASDTLVAFSSVIARDMKKYMQQYKSW